MIIKRIFNRLFPPKYTLEEYSQKIVAELRNGGAKIGNNVDIIDASIDRTSLYLLTIGDNVTITNCRILTHDASTKKILGCVKLGHVNIGSNVFIGANSIILPNITIGDNVIIGAGTVVSKNIQSNSVVIGNPAQIICSFDEYKNKHIKLMNEYPVVKKTGGRIDFVDQEIISKKGFGYTID